MILKKIGGAATLWALLLILNLSTTAQFAAANLSGTVTDEQGAVIANTTIKIVDKAKSAERTVQTNADGFFTFAQLAPSNYQITVTGSGFADNKLEDVVLNASDQKNLRVTLRVANAGAIVDVADTTLVSDSPTVSTVINRQFVENQPLNGRSFQTLVELSPGVVLTPSTLPSAGQFSVNGQRTSSNYLTVDGVSGNFGSTASVTLYETAGGAVRLGVRQHDESRLGRCRAGVFDSNFDLRAGIRSAAGRADLARYALGHESLYGKRLHIFPRPRL